MAALRHGVFLPPIHPMRENPTLCLQRDLQLMELLDDLGYNEAWIGEHHSGGTEIIDSPEIFIAAAAERTKRLRFGTGVVSLPYHNPLNVANRMIQLDHMTFGRVSFGAGPGLLASDALAMGIEPGVTRARFAQALDVILRLFRGEVVTEQTDWYTLREARTHLKPYSTPHPEVCVASAFTPSGGKLAGRHGLGMLCVAATDPKGFNALDVNWRIACDTAAEYGQMMDRDRLRVVMYVHLADDREEAKQHIRVGLQDYLDYINNSLPRFIVPDGRDPVDWFVESGFAAVGTPDDAIDQIDQLLGKQGEFGAVLLFGHNWADWEQTKRSYELYARYVMPHYNGANVARRASFQWVAANRAEMAGKRVDAAEAEFAKYEEEARAKGDAGSLAKRPTAGGTWGL